MRGSYAQNYQYIRDARFASNSFTSFAIEHMGSLRLITRIMSLSSAAAAAVAHLQAERNKINQKKKKKLFTISYQNACFQLTNVDNLLLILLAKLIIEMV